MIGLVDAGVGWAESCVATSLAQTMAGSAALLLDRMGA